LKQEQGALIGGVLPGSPADQSGLKRGDIVLEYDSKKVEEPFDLSAYVASSAIGKTIKLKVLRQGKEQMIEAKVGKRPEEGAIREEKSQAPKEQVASDVLGLSVRDITPEDAKKLNLPSPHTGVIVDQVQPGSSAEDHDVREGDLLLEINGVSINSAGDYEREAKKLNKGSLARLLIGRGSMTIYVAFRI